MRVGEYDRPDIEDFFAAFQNFVGLLKDVDAALAQKKKGNLRWKVTSLTKSPMPVIGVTSYLRRTVEDITSRVEREIFGNIAALNEKSELTRTFSDSSLARIERIAKTTPRIGNSVIYIDTREAASPTVNITRETLEQVESIREPKSASWGTIYGKLGAIYVHNGNEYRVWDEDSGRPVVCTFKPSEEQSIKDLLRYRVAVSGMIQANTHGLPISIRRVDQLEQIRESDLPTIEEMVGIVPDFTGGLSLKEYFEEMDT
jgi:hypothetical protein